MDDLARVMTFNVRWDTEEDGEDRWPHRRTLVADTIRFHRPDLLGIQEALLHQYEYLRESISGFEWVGVGRKDGEEAGEFVPIGYRMDRFDRHDWGTFWLSETPGEPSKGWDARRNRILTWARLEDRRTDTRFLYCNTHFDHEGKRARLESADLLHDRLPALADGKPIVLTGDFNATPGMASYDRLTDPDAERRLRDAGSIAKHGHHGPETTRTDFHTLVHGGRIDHVFVTEDVKVCQQGVGLDRTEERYPSDHLPVIADMTVGEGSAAGDESRNR